MSIQALLRKLINLYPRALFGHPHRVRPLADEADGELVQRHGTEMGKHSIRTALFLYRNSRGYFEALAEGRAKIDLRGQPSVTPTAEEQETARQWLVRLGHLCLLRCATERSLGAKRPAAGTVGVRERL